MKDRELIEESISLIVSKGTQNDMEDLSTMMVDLLCDIKKYDEKLFNKYKMDLYIKAHGKILNKEMAEEIIQGMKPYGMHWTFEQTEDVRKKNNILDIRDIDFWVVMNSGYNDQHSLCGEDLDKYITYTKNFINDPDAKPGKVFTYFTVIPN